MENLFLSVTETNILLKSKNFIENHYKVAILMPEIVNQDVCSSDLNLVTVIGENAQAVQNFLNSKLKNKKRRMEKSRAENSIPTITLSDSDSDSSSDDDIADVVIEKSQVESTNSSCRFSEIIPIPSTKPAAKRPRLENQADFISFLNDDIAIDNKKHEESMNADDSVIILEADLSVVVTSPAIATTSRNQERSQPQSRNQERSQPQSRNQERSQPQSRNQGRMEPQEDDADDSIIILDPEPVIAPVKKNQLLRPVIIDGSNVARAHGQLDNTYSCKGIKICIDYFLERGHTQVTAMVPLFRRYCRGPIVPTTDADLLDDLSRKQLVVFTPSRKVDGKTIVCYDDRFIVELASRTDGVIVSNDNFRDLAGESEEFKKTIKERLLMFCFAADVFMIPKDPMGRNGPTADQLLSFPDTENNP